MSEQRLIGAEALKQDMCDKAMSIYDIDQIINNAPTIEAVPVVRGKWVKIQEVAGVEILECSVCGWQRPQTRSKFCRDCGARMDGDT